MGDRSDPLRVQIGILSVAIRQKLSVISATAHGYTAKLGGIDFGRASPGLKRDLVRQLSQCIWDNLT